LNKTPDFIQPVFRIAHFREAAKFELEKIVIFNIWLNEIQTSKIDLTPVWRT